MNQSNVHPNSVLISESLLITVSRLLQEEFFTLRLFVDLSSLIEAVTLHDELLVLPAAHDESLSSYQFRELLFENKICRQTSAPSDTGAINEGIRDVLALRKIPWDRGGIAWSGHL